MLKIKQEHLGDEKCRLGDFILILKEKCDILYLRNGD